MLSMGSLRLTYWPLAESGLKLKEHPPEGLGLFVWHLAEVYSTSPLQKIEH